jgi:hypothetical protein
MRRDAGKRYEVRWSQFFAYDIGVGRFQPVAASGI